MHRSGAVRHLTPTGGDAAGVLAPDPLAAHPARSDRQCRNDGPGAASNRRHASLKPLLSADGRVILNSSAVLTMACRLSMTEASKGSQCTEFDLTAISRAGGFLRGDPCQVACYPGALRSGGIGAPITRTVSSRSSLRRIARSKSSNPCATSRNAPAPCRT